MRLLAVVTSVGIVDEEQIGPASVSVRAEIRRLDVAVPQLQIYHFLEQQYQSMNL